MHESQFGKLNRAPAKKLINFKQAIAIGLYGRASRRRFTLPNPVYKTKK
jgi:hypothetical protein